MILLHTLEINFSKHSSIIFSSILGNILISENNKKINIVTLTKLKIKTARSSTLNRAKKEILEYLSSRRKKFGFKVFPEGTVFQKIVWGRGGRADLLPTPILVLCFHQPIVQASDKLFRVGRNKVLSLQVLQSVA